MEIAKTSSWNETQIAQYLETAATPLRLAVNDGSYPMICSLWYEYDARERTLFCVSHQRSYLIKLLQRDASCGFEVAPNEPPYKGVRGKADISLERDGAGERLERLITRYLNDTDSGLARWLLSRVDEEYVLRVKPHWLTAWDYSSRM